MSGYPVVIVDSGGFPVTVANDGWSLTAVTAAIGGLPVTIVDSGGYPVIGIGSALGANTGAGYILDSLQTETNGLALGFMDGSGLVRDTTTPANDFSGDINDLLTYTSPSAKNIFNQLGVMESGTTLRCDHDPATLTSSTTSISISDGVVGLTMTFAHDGGDEYATGQYVRASDTSNSTTKYAVGVVTASSSGSVTISTIRVVGSGTVADWKIIRALGLLVEPEATNLIPYSKDVTLSFAETGPMATMVKGSEPDLTGTDNMWLIADDNTGGTGSPRPRLTTNSVSGSTYTFSFFAKKKQLSWCYVFMTTFRTSGGVYFDLENGVKGTEGAGYTGNITHVKDGIYLVEVTFTATATSAAARCEVYLADSNGDFTVDLDGTSDIYWSDPQLEVGTRRTSTIETTGSAVTRLSDYGIDLAGSDFPLSATGGSLVVRHTPKVPTAGVLVSLGSSSTEEIEMYSSTGSHLLVTDGGVVQANLDAGVNSTANTEFKTAASWEANDFAAVIDGGTVATDVSGTLPVIDTLSLFRDFAGLNGYHGHVQEVVILPRRVANVDLAGWRQ
jgi:hypothetical protein